MSKTNAMRILDNKKIPYETYEYDKKGFLSAKEVAEIIGISPENIYKTLVTEGGSNNYVFILPGDHELSNKKASKVAGVKSINLINPKDITQKTGYVKGGCSPIGMKHEFKTFIDNSALDKEFIVVSAGKLGAQIKVNPKDIIDEFAFEVADITR